MSILENDILHALRAPGTESVRTSNYSLLYDNQSDDGAQKMCQKLSLNNGIRGAAGYELYLMALFPCLGRPTIRSTNHLKLLSVSHRLALSIFDMSVYGLHNIWKLLMDFTMHHQGTAIINPEHLLRNKTIISKDLEGQLDGFGHGLARSFSI